MRAKAMREFFPVWVLRIEPTRAWAQSIPKRLEEGDSDLRTRISVWPVGVAVGLTSETRCCPVKTEEIAFGRAQNGTVSLG
jgi:hypothetical protein